MFPALAALLILLLSLSIFISILVPIIVSCVISFCVYGCTTSLHKFTFCIFSILKPPSIHQTQMKRAFQMLGESPPQLTLSAQLRARRGLGGVGLGGGDGGVGDGGEVVAARNGWLEKRRSGRSAGLSGPDHIESSPAVVNGRRWDCAYSWWRLPGRVRHKCRMRAALPCV